MLVVSSEFEELIGLADRIMVMSDGVSVSEMPSRLLSVGGLTMFAAPRSSAQRTHAVLEALVAGHGGVASWIDLEGSRLFCFDRVGGDAAADPGFSAGTIHDVADVAIASALRARAGGFVGEADGRNTLLVPIIGPRGHELGLICLCLPAGKTLPDADAIARTVASRLSVQNTLITGEAA